MMAAELAPETAAAVALETAAEKVELTFIEGVLRDRLKLKSIEASAYIKTKDAEEKLSEAEVEIRSIILKTKKILKPTEIDMSKDGKISQRKQAFEDAIGAYEKDALDKPLAIYDNRVHTVSTAHLDHEWNSIWWLKKKTIIEEELAVLGMCNLRQKMVRASKAFGPAKSSSMIEDYFSEEYVINKFRKELLEEQRKAIEEEKQQQLNVEPPAVIPPMGSNAALSTLLQTPPINGQNEIPPPSEENTRRSATGIQETGSSRSRSTSRQRGANFEG